MSHGLIITDCDPLDASFDRYVRLNQAARLYFDAGCSLDVVFLGNRHFDIDLFDQSPLVVDGAAGIGILPSDLRHHHEDHANPHLLELIAGLRGERDAYDIVHLDQVLVQPRKDLGRCWMVDSYDCPFGRPWNDQRFDVLFAADDEVRSANADLADQSIRLPPGVLDASQRHSGQMIGWVGPFNSTLVQRWTELLDVLARRGARLRPGVLLAGEGADAVRVPPALSTSVVTTGTVSPGAVRALALAVLPSGDADGWLARLTSLIAAECPVLTVAEVAGKFQDRWHLPTCEDANGFADAIEAWCAGQGCEAIHATTRTSAEAFSYDRAAMHSHVKNSLPVLERAAT